MGEIRSKATGIKDGSLKEGSEATIELVGSRTKLEVNVLESDLLIRVSDSDRTTSDLLVLLAKRGASEGAKSTYHI